MDTTKYEVFAQAVKLGSLSKAAQEMGYTQSGVSHMMKSLEQEVGFPLFIRTASGVQPNDEGEVLLPLIGELLQSNQRLEQTIGAIKGMEVGSISVACFSSAAIFWLPAVLREFERRHPHIKIQINEGGVDVIEGLLESAQVDVAVYARTARTGFDWIDLRHDPLYAVLPKTHPMAGAASFPVSAFSEEGFIAPGLNYDYDVHRVLDGLEKFPDVKYTSRNDYAIIAMVASGLGITILPELILQDSMDKICALPLDPPFYRELGIGAPSLKQASPAALQFIHLLRRMVGSGPSVMLP